jgi:hypothetical protein
MAATNSWSWPADSIPRRSTLSIPRIEFSVGRSHLEPGGKPEDALRASA